MLLPERFHKGSEKNANRERIMLQGAADAALRESLISLIFRTLAA
jgi:hypothetical protein